MGATGQIGHVLTQNLLKSGHKVRALGRNPKKLGTLKAQGAEVISLERFDDANALRTAFLGSDAIFSLVPPDYVIEDFYGFQVSVGEAITSAVKKGKVTHAPVESFKPSLCALEISKPAVEWRARFCGTERVIRSRTYCREIPFRPPKSVGVERLRNELWM